LVRVTPGRVQIIDEYGRTAAVVAAIRPDSKRLSQLKDQILEWVASEAADRSFVLEGKSYQIQITERTRESAVDIPRAFRFLGRDRFFEAANISVTELKRLLTPEQFEDVVTYDRTGERRVNALQRVIEMKLAS
jgi:hypothetical protein